MALYQRILVPVDGSPHARRALDEAIALARLTGARVIVTHAIDEPFLALGAGAWIAGSVDLLGLLREGAAEILGAARDVVTAAGVLVESVLLDTFDGRVCDLVVQAARTHQADLIVIGSHGRRGLSRALLGSDAEQILRLAPVPVLLVHAPVPPGAMS